MPVARIGRRARDPDLDAILAAGSKSFAAAARLLPPRVRRPATAVYAFCREADDAVDGEGGSLHPVESRLDRIYRGTPDGTAIERVMSRVVREHDLPRGVFEAMLEGFGWDASGRRYDTLEELTAYCVRVASTVGVLMSILMDERRPQALARACDLGVAMQLTNIARDVGEDARMGRVYIPLDWLAELGVDPDRWLADPHWSRELGLCVRRLLQRANELYQRADAGIAMLPRDCRPAICAARLIYADIGRVVERRLGYDTGVARAHTGRARKAWLLARALPSSLTRAGDPIGDSALPAAAFLVDLARGRPGGELWADADLPFLSTRTPRAEAPWN